MVHIMLMVCLDPWI